LSADEETRKPPRSHKRPLGRSLSLKAPSQLESRMRTEIARRNSEIVVGHGGRSFFGLGDSWVEVFAVRPGAWGHVFLADFCAVEPATQIGLNIGSRTKGSRSPSSPRGVGGADFFWRGIRGKGGKVFPAALTAKNIVNRALVELETTSPVSSFGPDLPDQTTRLGACLSRRPTSS
jgi:hypothetical protein